jgi:hypothetical protein
MTTINDVCTAYEEAKGRWAGCNFEDQGKSNKRSATSRSAPAVTSAGEAEGEAEGGKVSGFHRQRRLRLPESAHCAQSTPWGGCHQRASIQ